MKTALEERVEQIKEHMRNAMPEIRRQVAVYEKKMKEGKLDKIPK